MCGSYWRPLLDNGCCSVDMGIAPASLTVLVLSTQQTETVEEPLEEDEAAKEEKEESDDEAAVEEEEEEKKPKTKKVSLAPQI